MKRKRHEIPFTGQVRQIWDRERKMVLKLGTWLTKRVLIPQRGAQKGKRKRGIVSGEEACLLRAKHPGTSG